MYFIFFALIFGASEAAFTPKVLLTDVPDDYTRNMKFQYYYGPTADDYAVIQFEDGLNLPKFLNFNANRSTVFYFPGWTEEPWNNQESVDVIAAAFLKANKDNIVVLDYSSLVKNVGCLDYLSAFMNVTSIGKAFGRFLEWYIPRVQKLELIHLVGHSLGSQIMSNAAKTYGAGKLKWLTGLDPAGPLFNLPFVNHLDSNDAEFVDVILTDAGVYGDSRSLGTVNFFPNRGTRAQPYCTKTARPDGDFCSHRTSWRYYAESVINPVGFPAKRCERNLLCLFYINACDCKVDGEFAYMGYGVNKSERGNYYLTTNNDSPFALGAKGLNFVLNQGSKYFFI